MSSHAVRGEPRHDVAVPAGRPAPLGELAPGRRVDPAAAEEFLALYQAENPRV